MDLNKPKSPEQISEAQQATQSLEKNTAIGSVQAEVSGHAAEVLGQREQISETPSQARETSSTQTPAQTAVILRAKVEAKLEKTTEPQLRQELTAYYTKQIKQIEQEVFWARFKNTSADQFSRLVARLRELRASLSRLAEMTFDVLKDLYRRIVLG